MTRSTLVVRSMLCGIAALVAFVPAVQAVAVSGSGAPAGVRCTIVGTKGPDRIVGTPGDDVICARGGDDVVHGGGGNDIIYGGRGDDRLYGGSGDDRLYGGKGDDRLYGGKGDDRLNGRRGNDRLYGGSGDDRLDGRDGAGFSDRLQCDGGRNDVALADARDVVSPTCEQVRRHPPAPETPVPPSHVNVAPTADAKTLGGVAFGDSTTLTLSGSDADGDSLTFHVVQPVHGSVDTTAPAATCSGTTPSTCTATVVYTPAVSFSGSDSFTYRVNDGAVDSAPATVDVTVDPAPNNAPAADAKNVAGVPEDGNRSIDLSGSDVDGDPLTFEVTQPAHGSLTTLTPAPDCDTSTPSHCTATVGYTPDADYHGSDSFTYTVDDGTTSSTAATVTITITPVNDAPQAVGDTGTVAEDGDTSIDLSGSDVDGDPLTFAVTEPTHGSLTTLAPASDCDASTPSQCTATVGYTPDADYHGSDSFTYTVDDGTTSSTAATVTITVTPVNDAPVATDGEVGGPQDTDLSVPLDTLVSDVETSAADLTYTIVTNPSHGTLGGSGATRTYTPTAGYTGSDSFTYSVTDRGDPDDCTTGAPGCDAVKTSSIKTVSISVFPAGCFTDDAKADFEAGTAAGCDASTVPGSLQLGASAPVVDQSNGTVGTSGVGVTTTTWAGQTFTPSLSGALTRLDVHMFCSGCTGTTPDLTVSIRATSGGLPTGSDLATGTITGFSSGADVRYTATFATPYSVTAGTQYAFVVRPTANPSPGTYALTRSGSSTAGADVYAGGTRVAGATSGTVWSIPLTGGVSTDAGFQVHILTGTGFQTSGTFTSSVKDAAPAAGQRAEWSALTFDADAPAGTTVRFQVAASNSSTGPFTFVGPDGTADTYFTTSGASLDQFDGMRYLQYRAYLSTTDDAVTPALHSVTVCYVLTPTPPPPG
ncbi:tandem-95 repeat protein [Nocardioides sp. LMS-CY]|uniref:Ig-like domain-containing protein n=1 Tax=Nocardioides sp. (strain LMS-CY) TaxID=2840457 RepID=UPI001C006F55|nr:Ig-like domain-containing protein [Nocardioides sp. LMS-CY]QWF21767.1 tandem-95 repeat protein [Nocardioides sp. LMS-CY]